jgi:hypothetical protein
MPSVTVPLWGLRCSRGVLVAAGGVAGLAGPVGLVVAGPSVSVLVTTAERTHLAPGHRVRSTRERRVSGSDDNPVVRAVFRLPRSAYLPVLFLGFGVTVLVSSWAWTAVYLVPLLGALFVARRATVVDARQISVRAMFGSERIPWTRVRGLLISERGHVSVALDDQSAVLLPYVRVRHLPVLSQVSGNLVPAIPARVPGKKAEAAAETPSDQ